MSQRCETTFNDGTQCRGTAYGAATQCLECVLARRPPATEYTFTVVADSYAEARRQFQQQRAQFENDYPHVRLSLAGETQDYRYTKSRTSIGQRQHWQRFILKGV